MGENAACMSVTFPPRDVRHSTDCRGGFAVRLTVYFEGQFWVGVVEEIGNGKVKACRYVFGSEPKDVEVWEFVNNKMLRFLDQVVQAAEANEEAERRINPKRMARLIAREMQKKGVSTQAQEALKLELESRKKERKQVSRVKREEIKEKKRAIKVQKAKQKRKGK